MTCLECAQRPARSRGLCAACYIRYLRMIEDSRTTDRPITWDDLVALGKAAPSRLHESRRTTLEELQRAVYARKRTKARPCKREPDNEEEIRQRIDRLHSQRILQANRLRGVVENPTPPDSSSSSMD